ncbi:response regulator transcription factor [Cohnella lupini]|jgi:two-component system response regulator ResD|uniref:DNA-binding response OmpR family regulator n=1 Tax=Cohnella lupini TaxID=1294267 RepID=A0A3D9IBQ1_9BACL|nr:response regulator transcription factor [Cohnella lupini]RED59198.1 DNA-binding response OmpR family regulator [Cohnella lupini]
MVIFGYKRETAIIHKRIMVVDDDPSIVKIIKLYLTKHGYEVEDAGDGFAALNSIQSGRFDLAVLDLMLPRLDGWAVCRQLRENGDMTPIIMLTARGEVHERIEGLRMGADDYLVKPFDPNELLARIDSVLRRTAQTRTGMKAETQNELNIGNLSLLMDSYTTAVDSKPVSLTRREFDLISFLARRPGKVYSREDLISQVWGWDFDGEDRVVDLYVQRIRRKLGNGDIWSLTTVWGVGYKFEVNA